MQRENDQCMFIYSIKVYSSSSSNSISVEYKVVVYTGLGLLSVIYLQFESHLKSGKETVTHT